MLPRLETTGYAPLDWNWGGGGAGSPSEQAVNDVLTFPDRRPPGIPLPYPEEGTEGDVGVYWDIRHAKVFVEVMFEGDGMCAYFAVRGVPGNLEEKYGNDSVNVTGPWPEDVLRVLRIQNQA